MQRGIALRLVFHVSVEAGRATVKASLEDWAGHVVTEWPPFEIVGEGAYAIKPVYAVPNGILSGNVTLRIVFDPDTVEGEGRAGG